MCVSLSLCIPRLSLAEGAIGLRGAGALGRTRTIPFTRDPMKVAARGAQGRNDGSWREFDSHPSRSEEKREIEERGNANQIRIRVEPEKSEGKI